MCPGARAAAGLAHPSRETTGPGAGRRPEARTSAGDGHAPQLPHTPPPRCCGFLTGPRLWTSFFSPAAPSAEAGTRNALPSSRERAAPAALTLGTRPGHRPGLVLLVSRCVAHGLGSGHGPQPGRVSITDAQPQTTSHFPSHRLVDLHLMHNSFNEQSQIVSSNRLICCPESSAHPLIRSSEPRNTCCVAATAVHLHPCQARPSSRGT